jgi:NAD(P)H dehydrogenase (quinone)
MSIKVNVIFYSMYGHVYRMAEAVAAGMKEVPARVESNKLLSWTL